MKLQFTGEVSQFGKGLYDILNELHIEIGESDKKVEIKRAEKGFSVSVAGNKAEIAYNTLADFYRGLSITADALQNGYDISISQSPVFETCGIMLDVSRGAVLKVEKVKGIMRRLARMGFNELMLYTEDTYEVKEYPYFGYMRGRYTEEELKEIVAYGNLLGIEVVPCIQTLGHLASPLRWSAFNGMRDQAAVLLIDEERTYQFIEAMIKTVRRCFTSNKIHIGMDEAHGVGLGAYFNKHGLQDRFTILTRHLKRVMDICKSYSFEPMMWSDMFFRLGTKDGEYYSFEAEMPDNIADMIPDGISQVYWDYYNNSENVYNVMIREHNRMECPVIFAGGVWTWSGPSVNLRQSFESTIPALKVCKERGITHVLATLWGDGGAECDVLQSLYGLQYYAEYNYDCEHAMENLDKMFKICNGFEAEAFRLLDVDDFGQEIYAPDEPVFAEFESHIVSSSKQVLYQNPLIGLFDKNFAMADMHSHYSAIDEKLKSITVPEELSSLFDVHKQLVKVLTSKCDIGIRMKKAYDDENKEILAQLASEAKTLADDIGKLKDLRMKLWFENNKPFGYEMMHHRLSAAESVTRLASERLESYLDGSVASLEELEAERLLYNNIDRPFFMEYFFNRIQMPMV
ncbi:MAG: family 20 glycosylhydrolase [Clostridia bacterium]|nr:family 20 glycosylhydrolase [Clostridia bacterium]